MDDKHESGARRDSFDRSSEYAGRIDDSAELSGVCSRTGGAAAVDPRHQATVTLEVGFGYGISTLYICEALAKIDGTADRHRSETERRLARRGTLTLKRAGYSKVIQVHCDASSRVMPLLERAAVFRDESRRCPDRPGQQVGMSSSCKRMTGFTHTAWHAYRNHRARFTDWFSVIASAALRSTGRLWVRFRVLVRV